MRPEPVCLLLATLWFSIGQPAGVAEPKPLFDGKTVTGWEGETAKTWRMEEGAIVGGSLDAVVPRNEFL